MTSLILHDLGLLADFVEDLVVELFGGGQFLLGLRRVLRDGDGREPAEGERREPCLQAAGGGKRGEHPVNTP
jgi:hypothetical protein